MLLVLAVLVGLPFAIPTSLVVITIGGPILGALCVIASAVAGLEGRRMTHARAPRAPRRIAARYGPP